MAYVGASSAVPKFLCSRVLVFVFFLFFCSTLEHNSVSISSEIHNPERRIACLLLCSLYLLLS